MTKLEQTTNLRSINDLLKEAIERLIAIDCDAITIHEMIDEQIANARETAREIGFPINR